MMRTLRTSFYYVIKNVAVLRPSLSSKNEWGLHGDYCYQVHPVTTLFIDGFPNLKMLPALCLLLPLLNLFSLICQEK